MQTDKSTVTNSRRTVTVSKDDLPLHCPMPKSTLWNSHPRVYIPVEAGGGDPVICPYCGAQYLLKQA